jgi:hypothetical protein
MLIDMGKSKTGNRRETHEWVEMLPQPLLPFWAAHDWHFQTTTTTTSLSRFTAAAGRFMNEREAVVAWRFWARPGSKFIQILAQKVNSWFWSMKVRASGSSNWKSASSSKNGKSNHWNARALLESIAYLMQRRMKIL